MYLTCLDVSLLEYYLNYPTNVRALIPMLGSPGKSLDTVLGISGFKKLFPLLARLVNKTGSNAARIFHPILESDIPFALGRRTGMMNYKRASQADMRHYFKHMTEIDPAFYVGEGKLDEIQILCREKGPNLIIFDDELSPTQVNKLDGMLGIKVIDRTELILQISARRASSEESQAQVELAQLQYVEHWVPDQRQSRSGAGIGMRGPGETPLQVHKATMRQRMKPLKQKLERIGARRGKTREHRNLPSVCLVGYTNAGKSTLLNALTGADIYVDDRLFATLDTTTRLVHLGLGQEVLVSDTVGFIRHLPHRLVASFR